LILLAAYAKLRTRMLNLYSIRAISHQALVTNFLYAFLLKRTLSPLFFAIKNFLILIISSLTFFKVIPKIFLISNDNVSAKFLARFMAKKLKQQYRVREIANPIKREYFMLLVYDGLQKWVILKNRIILL
jgi:hypothetical protein